MDTWNYQLVHVLKWHLVWSMTLRMIYQKKKCFIPNFHMTSEYKACVIFSKAYILHLCYENSINPETGLLMP